MIETRQILEELRLKNVLATSSTGAVFLAEDPETGGDVVIKVVSSAVPGAEQDVRRLFLAMAEVARSVEVKAMPALTDHGLTPEGDGFLVMDFVDGRTLDSLDELSAFAVINILLDVLSCIEELAGAGTAHLNLKPNNIFVTNSPSYDRAKVLGFGTSATLIHAGVGVPVPAADPHLAPELVAGELLPVDQGWRSDLFSLGVIACSALGAEIEANGYDRPRVKIPDPIRGELPEPEPLEEMLGQIMAPDPMLRGTTPSDVRDPLIRALPNPPVLTRAPRATPSSTCDPNQTDPLFEPASLRVIERAPVPARAASDETDESDEDSPIGAGHEDDGWPEVLFDDPELPASLDDGDDTDVRNPVPEDVWVPPVAAEPITGGSATAVSPRTAAAGGGRRVSRLEIGLVAVVVVILGSIIALSWSTGGNDQVIEVGTIPIQAGGSGDVMVPPPPDTNLFDDLLAIQRLVEAGDLDRARSDLDKLFARDDGSWSSDEAALYDSLVTAVAVAADRGAAIDDLRTGLGYGSIKMIRRGAAGLAGMNALELAEVDGLAEDLERARRALGLHQDMWDAHSAGNHLVAITTATELERRLPGYSGAPELREQSATALELSAEALVADGEYQQAVSVLEGLNRAWPDRPGVAARIVWCREQLAQTRQEESAIASALALGAAGDPEGGLARLDALAADARLQEQRAEARSTLEAQLAGMDAGAPTIELADGVELAFKKNETILVPLKVTDDYRVERVVVHARNQSDDVFLQIPLECDGDGLYRLRVTPELHGNTDVTFFVVARDRSGHVGRFGSENAPQTITRKKWFKKLL